MNICDRVILIDNGKIAWDGSLADYKKLVEQRQSQIANKKNVS
jgi:ABC-type multidrug transport system ATPase subunit